MGQGEQRQQEVGRECRPPSTHRGTAWSGLKAKPSKKTFLIFLPLHICLFPTLPLPFLLPLSLFLTSLTFSSHPMSTLPSVTYSYIPYPYPSPLTPLPSLPTYFPLSFPLLLTRLRSYFHPHLTPPSLMTPFPTVEKKNQTLAFDTNITTVHHYYVTSETKFLKGEKNPPPLTISTELCTKSLLKRNTQRTHPSSAF